MAISSPGIGSGLDISGIISKLMSVEQQPLSLLNNKEASFQSKISALGSLQGAVSTLNTAVAALVPSANQTAITKFTTYKASVADSSVASASADSTSVTGSYSLSVDQIATTHRVSTTARAHILTSGDYLNATDPIFTAGQQLTISVAGTPKVLTLGNSDLSLNGLASAINTQGTGISAQVVTDGSGAHMVLTSNTAGAAGAITMTMTGLPDFSYDPGTGNVDFTETQAASGGYTSATAAIATGILKLKLGSGTERQITIDSTNNTLGGLRDAINNAGLALLPRSAPSAPTMYDWYSPVTR
jgi:flagellar hook-associated protein 2